MIAVTIDGISESQYHNYYARLDVNGEVVAKFITQPLGQSTHMAVLQLKAGGKVSVKNTAADEHILGEPFSSFSGFLLYESYGSSVIG